MSIRSEINRINVNVANAYTALLAKGATMPSTKNTNNLVGAIESIPVNAEAMSIETIWAICGYEPNGGLPDGYTLLEYIQSSGTQYIDTGFVTNSNTRIVVDCMATAVTSFPFGVRGASITNGFDAAVCAGQVFYNYGNVYQFAAYANVYERMVIDANKNVATFTGSQTVTITLAAATFTTPHNMVLFSLNENGSVYTGDNAFRGRIYSCLIYDNGTLIRDFVPCINASGAYGLYDKVNSQFYGNAGSGSFSGA